MLKEYQKYRALITKLEQVNKNKSSVYRFCLGSLAVFGYLFIALILVTLILLCRWIIGLYMHGEGGVGITKIFIFVLITIYYLLRALWVTIPAPTGMEIRRQDAQELFTELDSISNFLQAPRFNVVLLDHDMNAAVSQVPRLGIFGWYKNYLIIGLPLMQALSLPEFRSVMVHELGHISGKHGKFGNWIWRLRITFAKIQESFENHVAMNLIFSIFFKWYAPLFMAYSSVLQRANEYEADKYAVKFTSPDSFAQGLSKIAMFGDITISDTWNKIQLEVLNADSAPSDILTRLSEEISKGLPETAVEKLQKAMKVNTDIDDSHPCLRERFTAVGIRDLSLPAKLSMLLQRSTHSAASDLFGSTEKTFEMKLNKSVKESMETEWKLKHDEALDNKKKLDLLSGKEELTEDETWEMIQLKGDLYGSDSVADNVNAMLEKWPGNLDAKFYKGMILLKNDNDDGINIIKEVMQADDRYQLYGNSMITGYLSSAGRDNEAEIFTEEGIRSAERIEKMHTTLATFNAKDEFITHSCSIEEINAIKDAVKKSKHIYRAYMVKKKLNIETKYEHQLLIIKPKFVGFVSDVEEESNKIVKLIEESIDFKDMVYISVLHSSSYNYIFKKLDKMADSLVYERVK